MLHQIGPVVPCQNLLKMKVTAASPNYSALSLILAWFTKIQHRYLFFRAFHYGSNSRILAWFIRPSVLRGSIQECHLSNPGNALSCVLRSFFRWCAPTQFNAFALFQCGYLNLVIPRVRSIKPEAINNEKRIFKDAVCTFKFSWRTYLDRRRIQLLEVCITL